MQQIKAIRVFVVALLILQASVFSVVFAADTADAEFAGECAMGLVEGLHIETDCELTWTAPDGKLYCFRSEDAMAVFLKDSERNIKRAVEFYAISSAEQTANHMGKFKSRDVKAFVIEHIEALTADNGGKFPLRDVVLDKDLELIFDEIDLVRTLMGYGYFPSVKFHRADDAEKRYHIDFWIRPMQGELSVVDTRIYKAPRKYKGKWTTWMRDPRPWWWIPASEHPGATEEKRAWEVVSAIENQIISEQDMHGTFQLVDEKTQEKIDLEFVGVHLPVRRLAADGQYFACSDFRKVGTKDEFYDIDFWLNEDDGSIQVGEVRVHKVPEMKDGGFMQIPRYTFDDLEFDLIP